MNAMYYNSQAAFIRSTIVMVVIFTLGLYVFRGLEIESTASVQTVPLYYYNPLLDEVVDGETQCSMSAVDAVERVVASSATTTLAEVRFRAQTLLSTPLNPIDERVGFTTATIPDEAEVVLVASVDSEIHFDVRVPAYIPFTQCQQDLLRSQLLQTVSEIDGVGTTSISFTR
jgi:hypothetical protein